MIFFGNKGHAIIVIYFFDQNIRSSIKTKFSFYLWRTKAIVDFVI